MRRFGFARLMLWLGLLFIYLPMIIMVIYSFNASKLVTVWGGWSLKWYFGLLDNKQLIGSVFRSLEIAFYTAIAAVALGTVAAFVLTMAYRSFQINGDDEVADDVEDARLAARARADQTSESFEDLGFSDTGEDVVSE